MFKTFKKIAVVLTAALFFTAAFIQAGDQAQAQSTKSEAKGKWAEFVGDYEFAFQGQVMLINFYEQEGKLFGAPAGQTPEELKPIKDKELQFEVNTTAGESFQIEFKRNSNNKVDKCLVRNQGQEIEGIKK